MSFTAMLRAEAAGVRSPRRLVEGMVGANAEAPAMPRTTSEVRSILRKQTLKKTARSQIDRL